jgi:dihydrofolate synthase/folylpolyglutamate synthase
VSLAGVAALLGGTFADLTDDTWRQGMLAVAVPGRLEIVNRAPTVVIDGAHNPHGARAAAAAVVEQVGTDVVLVVGVMADKDVAGVLAPWRDVAGHVVVAPAPSPRTASSAELRAVAAEVWGARPEVAVDEAPDVDAALAIAEQVAGDAGTIVACGSLYVAGAARDRYLPVLDTDDEVVFEPQDVDDDEHERRFEEALDLMIDRVDREMGEGLDDEAIDALEALDLRDED